MIYSLARSRWLYLLNVLVNCTLIKSPLVYIYRVLYPLLGMSTSPCLFLYDVTDASMLPRVGPRCSGRSR